MRKLFTYLLSGAMAFFVACGDDCSSNAKLEESGSSTTIEPTSSNTENSSQFVTRIKTDYLSFVDTIHGVYEFAYSYCGYDKSSQKFSWNIDKVSGVIDTIASDLFGYKVSNDTLYECDYRGKCDPATAEATTVYIGNSKTIIGEWTCIGRIYKGVFYEGSSFTKVTYTPTQRVTEIKINLNEYDMIRTGATCGPARTITNIDEIYDNCQKESSNPNATDSLDLGNNVWLIHEGLNKASLIVNGKAVQITVNIDATSSSTEIVHTATYNGKTCIRTTKNFNITEEFCKAAVIDNISLEYDDYKQATKVSEGFDNNEEFEECVAGFNLRNP